MKLSSLNHHHYTWELVAIDFGNHLHFVQCWKAYVIPKREAARHMCSVQEMGFDKCNTDYRAHLQCLTLWMTETQNQLVRTVDNKTML